MKIALKRTFGLLAKQPASLLMTVPSFNFNTTTTSKKILNVWDIPKALYMEMNDALSEAHTCNMLANLLKDNLHQITDYQLTYAIHRIWEDDLEVDEHFHNIIVPIVKEFVKNYNRENNKSLAELIQCLGWLKVQDDGLWQLFEQKLLQEKLYRYIPLKELCLVAHAMSNAQRGSPELFAAFEQVIIKQRLNLREGDIEVAKIAFENRPVGSQLVLDVLQNPTGDIKLMEQLQRDRTTKKLDYY